MESTTTVVRDESVAVVESVQTSIVSSSDDNFVTVVVEAPSVVSEETTSFVTTETKETDVVAVGQQGPQGITGAVGPTGPPGQTTVATLSVMNDDAEMLRRGMPVALTQPGKVRKASSSTADKCYAVVVDPTIDPAAYGLVADDGALVFPETDWDIVTADGGGLTPDAAYYLSPVAGRLTKTPTLGVGALVLVGFATNSTTLRLSLSNPIYF